MFREETKRVKRVLSLVYFGLLILRWCGPLLFLSKIAHQLYGRAVFLITIRSLDDPGPSSSFKCSVRLASPDDIKELFNGLRHESREGRYQLLVRQWYHKIGFGDCYTSRVADTNEICAGQWLVTPEHIRQIGWQERYPLDEDEIMIENAYTFEKYRRLGVAIVSYHLLTKLAQQKGYRYTKSYTDKANIPAIRWSEATGEIVYKRILERHFLFRVIRKELEQYDPPIRMASLKDIK